MYIMSNRTGSCAEARRGLAFARLMSVTDVQSSQLPTLLNAKPLRGTRYKYPSSLQLKYHVSSFMDHVHRESVLLLEYSIRNCHARFSLDLAIEQKQCSCSHCQPNEALSKPR